MDKMCISGTIANLIAEGLIKRCIKKHIGADIDLTVQNLIIDLSGDDCSIDLKASAKISEENRKKIAIYCIRNKRSGA